MKVEETDKGITVTCEGEDCKDFMEKMKKGEITFGPYYACCTPIHCYTPIQCIPVCVPKEKEEKKK